jgi:hypothetical protein
MSHHANHILAILDACCDAFSFPMLDNGYVYLAASRLSLHRSITDWALVIEVFGFSPRAGFPDLHVYTFASRLHERKTPAQYISQEAYERYLANNPHNESRFFFPIDEDVWQDPEDSEFVAADTTTLRLRGHSIGLPSVEAYRLYGIALEEAPRVQVFELCRFLAETQREAVLATPAERKASVLPEMRELIVLDQWRHPDLLDERPSTSRTFQQLSEVLATGDLGRYQADEHPNTHWSNWPEGGRL